MMVVPKLRFKNFNQNWNEYRLGEISSKIGSGSTPKGGASAYSTNGIPFIRSQNIHNDNLQLDDVVYISSEINTKMKGSQVKAYDILLNITGASIGRTCVVPGDFSQGNVNQHVCIIRLKDNNPKFFQSYLSSSKGQNLINNSQSGSGREGLNFQHIKAMKIFAPNINEQNKIANFLSSVDKKIMLQSRKIELLQQYKKGMMQNLFSQEIRFKDDKGNNFPEWNKSYIGDILTIGSGRDYKHLNTGHIPVFGTGGLMTMVDNFLHDGETVCIGRKGTIDKPFYYKGKIWTVDTLFYTHSFKETLPKFVYQLFLTINWKEYNEASGVPSLSKKTIEKIEILLPCENEQQKIADFLSSIDDKITIENNKLDKLKQWKQGLLQQMFV